MDKKVSILIPLYNAENYIQETINSCINQTYKNIEILIFDDGSTDSSLKLAKNFENNYSNIKVYTHKNSGAQITRNKLFKLSSGSYIQYLDADDILSFNKIKVQMDLLKNEDEENICFCRWKGFKNNIETVKLNKDLKIYKNYENPLNFLIDMWSNFEAVSPHAWLVHRNIISKTKGWNIELSKNQDGAFFSEIVMLSSKILFSDECFVYYRLDSENSISKNISANAAISIYKSLEIYKLNVKKHLNDYKVKLALAKILSFYNFDLYPNHKEIRKKIKHDILDLGFDDILPFKNDKKLELLYKVFGSTTMIFIFKFIKNVRNNLKWN